MALSLSIFTGCKQGSSLAQAKPAGKMSGSASTASEEKQEAMSVMFKGTVSDVINAGRYAYIQITAGEKKVWVAVPSFDGKPGDTVLVPPGVPVADFHSKKLNRTFDMIYFVGGIRKVGDGAAGETPQTMPKDTALTPMPTQNQMMHPPMDELAEAPTIEIGHIEKAKDGQTVSEIITGGKSLAGRQILVRAKVVKFTPNIMGKNWLHLRDGSGGEGANDLVVTTKTAVKVGDVVLVRGNVSVDRDFGFGFKYSVIMEDAVVTVE